jgi:hypothetical protein
MTNVIGLISHIPMFHNVVKLFYIILPVLAQSYEFKILRDPEMKWITTII